MRRGSLNGRFRDECLNEQPCALWFNRWRHCVLNLSIDLRDQTPRACVAQGTSKLKEGTIGRRGRAPPFSPDQIDAMNRAFKLACTRMGLTGSTPVIELVAVRIVELALAGEFDPDKLTDTVVAEFDL
jgi:hypothetical protein